MKRSILPAWNTFLLSICKVRTMGSATKWKTRQRRLEGHRPQTPNLKKLGRLVTITNIFNCNKTTKSNVDASFKT